MTWLIIGHHYPDMQEDIPEEYSNLHIPVLIMTEDIGDISITGPFLLGLIKNLGFSL